MPVSSSIRIWSTASDWVEFQYAYAVVEYPEIGERIRDRSGLVHWIRPDAARYPDKLILSLMPEELLKMNSSPGAPRYCQEWIEYHFRSQAELLVYVSDHTLADDGTAVARQLAYRCRILNLPPQLGGSVQPAGRTANPVELELAVHEDGSFTDPADIDSYQPFQPPR